jgi:hypothetical protein
MRNLPRPHRRGFSFVYFFVPTDQHCTAFGFWAAVPEPSGAALIVTALLALFFGTICGPARYVRGVTQGSAARSLWDSAMSWLSSRAERRNG